jgi:hypothetical protein
MRVDAYLAGGTASGTVHVDGHLRDLLETGTDLTMSGVTWRPLGGAPASTVGDGTVAIDDLLLVVSDEEPFIAMHHAWHDVGIDVGPYRLVGQLPTLPGFDPGRALTRPTGEFVLLKDVVLEPLDANGQTLSLPHALVNRYAVDRVRAHLMLGFFFPGAEIEASEPAVEASQPAPA